MTKLILFLFSLSTFAVSEKDLVDIKEVDPSILVEARYYGQHNFLGRVVHGYYANKCFLLKDAARALSEAQKEAKKKGYSLKVYDCYRPQKAVDHFVKWAKDLNDKKMKAEFYPKESKMTLFERGYIATKSGHSRGSTVDLTLVKLPIISSEIYKDGDKLKDCRIKERYKDNSIDMGTGYDCFDELSHTLNPKNSTNALQNRLLLKSIMEKSGFQNYLKEWWHYTLKDEPNKNSYFNVDVK